MTGRPATTDAYFDRTWATGDDPWAHTTRWSEARKYGLTAAVLPRARYRRSFEPGCGVGALTRLLADRSDHHLAMERHPRGVAVTTERCRDLDQVEVRQGRIPEDWPDGPLDLVVVSEVLYYLSSPELDRAIELMAETLEPGGDLVAVHYRPVVDEHTWTGDEVHDRLRAADRFVALGRTVEADVVIDVLRRR